MTVRAGQDMNDRTGWGEVSCQEADKFRGIQPVKPGSSLTDLSGEFVSGGVVYTEWWAATNAEDIPLLRDYLWHPHSTTARCEHFVPDEEWPDASQD